MPCSTPYFVEHRCQTPRRALELLWHPKDRHGLVKGERFDGLSVEDLIKQILLKHHADRLIDGALADQELSMATLANTLTQFADVIICVDPLDVHARGHDPAEGERRDGDAELGGCEVGVKMVDGSLERPGATLLLFHELCHSAAPDGDQGELGGDKEAIWPTSRRIARSPAMSIQMLLAVGIVTSHRPGAVSAAFALPPDPEQVWLSGLTPRPQKLKAEPAVEIGKGAAGK